MKKILMSFVLFTSLLFASNYKYEITPTIGGVIPEGNLDLSNQLSYGLRFGININTIFDQIELGFERSNSVDYDNSNANTDINRYFINAIKSYPLRDNLSLYSLIGVGYESIKNEKFSNNDSGFFNYGLGLKYKVTNNFSLRAEVRHAIKFDHGDNNLFYTVGFVIPFGKKAEPMAKVEPTPAPAPVLVLVPAPAPKPMPVVKKIAPTPKPIVIGDDDHDGVNNNEDLCPNTPVGNVVNSDGCVKVIHLHVTFATNKVDISNKYMIEIKKVANFMSINDNYTVILEGNTDSVGSKKYNQKLSILRANAVADVLEKLGVYPGRITKKGFGETNPIATNKTKEGRAQNRRVDAKFMK
ncbi:MAG: TonB-dependent receptor [Epsilonproteobacteria bacterium]|nr:TonB-dependent receptor [Campylobacterota bacterium]